MLRRRTVLGTLLAAPALGQPAWPAAGPIRLVVPFGPGGTTDIIARLLAEHVARELGQAVVIENRPGAGATLGTTMVARAAPDGYTLLLSVISAMATGAALYRGRIPWDPDRDFAHVAIVLGTPYLLVVHPRQPIATLADYVAAARRPPGLAFATSGVGSVPHLLGLRFAQAAGIELTHVPYRGGAQAATDVMAGVVPSMIDSLTAASANLRAGTVRALAFSSPIRIAAFADIPTFREAGYADVLADGWAGIAAPAGTPRPILERLAAAFQAAMEVPAVRARYAETSTQLGTRFLEDAQRFVREEAATWAPIVAASGATPDG